MNNTMQIPISEKGITICGQKFSEILFLSEQNEILGMITDTGEIVWHDSYKVGCAPSDK